jgi:hypothetical protein
LGKLIRHARASNHPRLPACRNRHRGVAVQIAQEERLFSKVAFLTVAPAATEASASSAAS